MTTYIHELDMKVKELWKRFMEKSARPEEFSQMRTEIYESWLRSEKCGVNPYTVKSKSLSTKHLQTILAENDFLISIARPYMDKLYSFIEGENFTIVIADNNGYLLETVGGISAGINETNESTYLKRGAYRNEVYSGTNGVGTCLVLQRPLQIYGAEHFVESHHNYTSSAAPIRDDSGNIIGCLNIVGLKEKTHSHTLGMVVAAVDGIEKEIKIRQAYKKISTVNQQLISTFQTISSGIIMIDEGGRIIQYNSRAADILNLPADLLSGKNIQDLITIESPLIDLLNLNQNFYNKEINLSTLKKVTINVSLTACGMYNDLGKKIGTVFSLETIQHVHKLVNRTIGFVAKYTFDSIIGISSQMLEVKKYGMVAANSNSNVLILGESGTGKELIAQAIHNASSRATGPFIAINCGSLPKALIESELFGYEGGSFTGASREGRPGKFELAEGGTIFLDEIGDMPIDLQVSLLRVLQAKEIVRIGGTKSKPINVRIMAATNCNLEESIQNNSFRKDLYYRLNVFSIFVPPLRERKEDLPLLANYFLQDCNKSMNKNVIRISDDTLNILSSYNWPGNVRELQNIIERGVNMVQADTIMTSHLPQNIVLQALKLEKETFSSAQTIPIEFYKPEEHLQQTGANPYAGSIKEVEKEMIVQALNRTAGNIKRASVLLGIGRRSLYRRIEIYKIDVESFRSI